jgi:hypothetical protein
MNAVSRFCLNRNIPAKIEEAFIAYIRSDYSQRFQMKKDGDTVKLVVSKMDEKQVEEAWREFVKELRHVLE